MKKLIFIFLIFPILGFTDDWRYDNEEYPKVERKGREIIYTPLLNERDYYKEDRKKHDPLLKQPRAVKEGCDRSLLCELNR